MKSGIQVVARWCAIVFLSAALVFIGFNSNIHEGTGTPAYNGMIIPVSEPASIVLVSISVLGLVTILRRQKNHEGRDNVPHD